MNRCLCALLADSIDYAGVFPPAQLPLDEALGNFVGYQSQPDRWMLGRFVCPAGQLERLRASPYIERLPPGCNFAVVVSTGPSSDDILENLGRGADQLRRFSAAHDYRLRIDSLELKLPPEALAWPGHIALTRFVEAVSGILAEQVWVRRLFYEVPASNQWHEAVISLVPVIAAATSKHLPIGLKLRAGGLEPSAFPSAADVAFFVAECNRAKIPWKATAGLHQPLRHFDEHLGVWHHGFLNLLIAAVFARWHELPENEIPRILEIETIDSFRFDDDGIGWRDLRVTHDQIELARSQSFVSFGSCSFDEPREGLQTLGLMEREL